MNLNEYIASERGNAARLASQLGVGISYISQMAAGHRAVSPARAVLIESITNGAVSRKEMREDWESIWPETAKA